MADYTNYSAGLKPEEARTYQAQMERNARFEQDKVASERSENADYKQQLIANILEETDNFTEMELNIFPASSLERMYDNKHYYNPHNSKCLFEKFYETVKHEVNIDRDLSPAFWEISNAIAKWGPEITFENKKPTIETKQFLDIFANFMCDIGGSSCDVLAGIMKDNIKCNISSISDDLKINMQEAITKHAVYPLEMLSSLEKCLKNINVTGDKRLVHVSLGVDMGHNDWVCVTDAPNNVIDEIVYKINQTYIDYPDEDVGNPDNEHFIGLAAELERLGYSFKFKHENAVDLEEHLQRQCDTFAINEQPELDQDNVPMLSREDAEKIEAVGVRLAAERGLDYYELTRTEINYKADEPNICFHYYKYGDPNMECQITLWPEHLKKYHINIQKYKLAELKNNPIERNSKLGNLAAGKQIDKKL